MTNRFGRFLGRRGQELNDLKRAYESVLQERDLLRAVLDSIPDPVYVKDTESRCIISNIADAAMIGGRTPNQIVGTTVQDFFPAEIAEMFIADDQAVIRSGNPIIGREELLTDEATGKKAWHSTSKIPLKDSQGKIVGLVGLGRDITRRKEAEAEVQELIAEIRDTANALSVSAAEILTAAMQQTSGASEQSAAITQTTTTVDELNTIAEQSVARSAEMAEAAKRTVEVAHAGQVMVQETIAGMDQIKARVESIAENILALSEKTQQIGEIISTVDNIASQSNMLALNASVEAARAGEQGEGFCRRSDGGAQPSRPVQAGDGAGQFDSVGHPARDERSGDGDRGGDQGCGAGGQAGGSDRGCDPAVGGRDRQVDTVSSADSGWRAAAKVSHRTDGVVDG